MIVLCCIALYRDFIALYCTVIALLCTVLWFYCIALYFTVLALHWYCEKQFPNSPQLGVKSLNTWIHKYGSMHYKQKQLIAQVLSHSCSQENKHTTRKKTSEALLGNIFDSTLHGKIYRKKETKSRNGEGKKLAYLFTLKKSYFFHSSSPKQMPWNSIDREDFILDIFKSGLDLPCFGYRWSKLCVWNKA